jgi:16S rRNA G966 N2-methylase RsmD
MICSAYYFQYKQLSKHRGLMGRLSETEIVNLLGHRVMQIATPEHYPPGSIVWCGGDLTPEAMRICQWIPFLAAVGKLEWNVAHDWSVAQLKRLATELREDYDAFQGFLESADCKRVLTSDDSWVPLISPQAFDYQSPARQSPYLIRAMFNLSVKGAPIKTVLDPMGGYGQTLFESVLREIDGATLEISPTASRRSAENLRKLLQRLGIPFEELQEEGRYLFRSDTSPPCTYQIINGDTRRADEYFQGQQFDSLITDFPYGVQAGSRRQSQSRAVTVKPIHSDQLLDSALPSWKHLLKPNGSIVIAYNLHTLPRETVSALIERHGFRQRFQGADLSERVSDKIHRDIVVFAHSCLNASAG